MPLQMALNNGHLETATLLQRHMGRKLREEAKQLKEERIKFWKRFAEDSSAGRLPRRVRRHSAKRYSTSIEEL